MGHNIREIEPRLDGNAGRAPKVVTCRQVYRPGSGHRLGDRPWRAGAGEGYPSLKGLQDEIENWRTRGVEWTIASVPCLEVAYAGEAYCLWPLRDGAPAEFESLRAEMERIGVQAWRSCLEGRRLFWLELQRSDGAAWDNEGFEPLFLRSRSHGAYYRLSWLKAPVWETYPNFLTFTEWLLRRLTVMTRIA